MEWKYSLIGDINSKTQQTVLRDIYVNHSKVLGIELDQQMGKETYVNQEGEKLLTVTYNPVGLPLSWIPQYGHGVNVSYDRYVRIFFYFRYAPMLIPECLETDLTDWRAGPGASRKKLTLTNVTVCFPV